MGTETFCKIEKALSCLLSPCFIYFVYLLCILGCIVYKEASCIGVFLCWSMV